MGLKVWKPDGTLTFDSASRPGRITGVHVIPGPSSGSASLSGSISISVGPGKTPFAVGYPYGRVLGGGWLSGSTYNYSADVYAGGGLVIIVGER